MFYFSQVGHTKTCVVLTTYTMLYTFLVKSCYTWHTCQPWNVSAHCGAKWVAARVLMTPMLLVIECGMVSYMSVLPVCCLTILANVYCFIIFFIVIHEGIFYHCVMYSIHFKAGL